MNTCYFCGGGAPLASIEGTRRPCEPVCRGCENKLFNESYAPIPGKPDVGPRLAHTRRRGAGLVTRSSGRRAGVTEAHSNTTPDATWHVVRDDEGVVGRKRSILPAD